MGRDVWKYLYIIATIILTVYGQLVIKWQVANYGQLPLDASEKILFLLRLLLNPWITSGFIAAFMASLTWMAAMTKFELSYAYPFMSSSFVMVFILSIIFFHESVSATKVIGMSLIVLGIFIGSQK